MGPGLFGELLGVLGVLELLGPLGLGLKNADSGIFLNDFLFFDCFRCFSTCFGILTWFVCVRLFVCDFQCFRRFSLFFSVFDCCQHFLIFFDVSQHVSAFYNVFVISRCFIFSKFCYRLVIVRRVSTFSTCFRHRCHFSIFDFC